MKQRGFTLVELSIVLVIIALLFVAVIQGQALIGRAKAKDVIAIVDDLRNATTLFRQRYKYLPGDLPNPASDLPNTTATTVGINGNGSIDGSVAGDGKAEAGSEVAELPLQLFQAGILSKIDQSEPQRRISTSFGAVQVVSKATADGLVPGFATATETHAVRNVIVFYHLPCDLVAEVDAKIDDGNVTTGKAFGTACGADGVMKWFAVSL